MASDLNLPYIRLLCCKMEKKVGLNDMQSVIFKLFVYFCDKRFTYSKPVICPIKYERINNCLRY